MPAVLLIDDDREMAELLAQSLRPEGYFCEVAGSGEAGLARVQAGAPDLVLLDVGLPGINGFEVLRRLRRGSDVPVIMLTARGEEVDRIVGLEIGADDYLPKPFSVRELAARMNAILRRVQRAPEKAPERAAGEIRIGAVVLHVPTRMVYRDGEPLHLTTSEFDLLRVLMESPGVPVEREVLSVAVLGREYSVFDRGIDNLVSAVRRKLGATPAGVERVKTIRNVGYLYADTEA